MRCLVLPYSQSGDVVLDPFLGSGQTPKVALQNGRQAVGYDVEQEYLRLAGQRLFETKKRNTHLRPAFEKIKAG